MSETKKDHRMQDILLYEQNLLDEDERKELEEHLPGCAECQATLVKVKHYLPLLKQALEPNELPAEELLRRVKAQMQAKKGAKVLPFRRARVAVAGFALAGAAAAAIAVQSFLPSLETAMVAKGDQDAGAKSGTVAAPRRPQRGDGGADGGSGMDGGIGEKGGEER
jgi:anti-sigma factor RsiW